VAIDVHGPLDRAKDVSPGRERRFRRLASGACAWRTLTTFPSSASKEHPLSPARLPAREETLTCLSGPAEIQAVAEPREGRSRPLNQDAFHRHDGKRAKGSLPPASCVGLPLTPPTLFPRVGDKCFRGALQALIVGVSPP